MNNLAPDPDTSFIHACTIEIKALINRTNQNLLEIGQKLLEVKARLGHGSFGEWLASEFEWSHDTAGNFMRVAQRFGDNPKISEFAPSALYLLAAPSTPEEARIEAIALAESGATISHTLAKSIVDRHKADDEDVVKLEAIASTSVLETIAVDERVGGHKSDSVPFHCLMNQQQRERLFNAINQAKSQYELKTTAEALDVISQEFLNAQ